MSYFFKNNYRKCRYFYKVLRSSFNEAITFSQFPSNMKLADIVPVFKKDDKNLKSNYRTISTLLNLSKVLEKIIHGQFSIFFPRYPLKVPMWL